MASKANKKRAASRNAKRAAGYAAKRAASGAAVKPAAQASGVDPEAELKGRARQRLRGAGFEGAELASAAEVVDEGEVAHGRRKVSRLKRVRGDDGLVFLWEEGRLTIATGPDGVATRDDWRAAQVLLNGGLAYRAAWESAEAGVLRSQIEDRVAAGGSGTSDGIVWGALDRAKLKAAVTQVEAEVVALFPHGRELTLLREVAGLGRSLRSVCGGGSAYPRALAALMNGLGVAARVFGIPGAEGLRGKASQAKPLQVEVLALDVVETVCEAAYEPVEIPEGEALTSHVRGRLLGPVQGAGGGS